MFNFTFRQRLLELVYTFLGNPGLPHVQLLQVLEASKPIQCLVSDFGAIEV